MFASDAPLYAEEIARADESLVEDRVEEAILELRTLYDETERAFQVVELGEGFQILTRSEFAPYLERFDTVPRPSRLSGPALETLAIIAYRQPIGRCRTGISLGWWEGLRVWGGPSSMGRHSVSSSTSASPPSMNYLDRRNSLSFSGIDLLWRSSWSVRKRRKSPPAIRIRRF